MTRPKIIHQGHLYQHGTKQVVAVETGSERVRVRVLDAGHPSGMGRAFITHAIYLSPLPMKYHGGQTP